MLEVFVEQYAIRFGERFSVSFQRTLRVPEDGRIYPLPPGLGAFPLYRAESFAGRVPRSWVEEKDAFIPMYQREALWLGFRAAYWKPNAVKIAVGGINALSGKIDDPRLHDDPQDYVVCPDQPWLDGINSGDGSIRQFVAIPLGRGYTVEGALTGSEVVGGVQITVFDPRPGEFPDRPPPSPGGGGAGRFAMPRPGARGAQPMGLGAGGTLRQKIYPDPHGIDVWDPDRCGRAVVHILNSTQFEEITGTAPPPSPIDAGIYTEHGLPWFDLYDEEKGDVPSAEEFRKVKGIAEQDRERGESAGETSVRIPETQIKKLGREDRE